MASLTHRHRQPEVMDQPDLPAADHVGALRALERINWISASARILWGPIRRLALELKRPISVLDVATGAGDLPIRLWHKAKQAGIDLKIDGCDVSATALDHARRRAREKQAEVGFVLLDAFQDELPTGYDVLTCSLFLHHLDEPDAIGLLRKMGHAAGRLVLVNDLRRSRIGWLLAWLGTRLLTRSWVARIDGPLSVEAAFTPEEAGGLAEKAGLSGAVVQRRWPWRWLLQTQVTSA